MVRSLWRVLDNQRPDHLQIDLYKGEQAQAGFLEDSSGCHTDYSGPVTAVMPQSVGLQSALPHELGIQPLLPPAPEPPAPPPPAPLPPTGLPSAPCRALLLIFLPRATSLSSLRRFF